MIYDLQKAGMWKRISAWLFDMILLAVVAALFGYLISTAVNYDGYAAKLNDRYSVYEAEYGVNLHMSSADYEGLSEEEKLNAENAYHALSMDDEAVYAYGMMTQLTLIITTFGILLAFIVMEFTIPMAFGNGQTLGKKIFGIALMTKEGVRVYGKTLFARTILGKFAVETMIPVYIVIMIFFGTIGILGPLILAALLLVQAVMLISTSAHSAIHDAIASTVAVDFGSQMIFDTREELIEYKNMIHAQKVQESAY
ncbi:MAG: RDD family protein [Clostridia bacterium]|nr:RDD family protein [Clostridia bacterium]